MTGARGEGGDGAGRKSFADHMAEQGDVVRVRRDRAAVPQARQPARLDRSPGRARRPGGAGGSRAPLRTPDPDAPDFAHRSFVRRGVLRDLRAGRIRPERTVDLHGLDRARAERRVHDAIGEASRAGLRCVRVVTGRGLHSAAGTAVLRESLPAWLAHPALSHCVAAFAPAAPQDGGAGALYVLLG